MELNQISQKSDHTAIGEEILQKLTVLADLVQLSQCLQISVVQLYYMFIHVLNIENRVA